MLGSDSGKRSARERTMVMRRASTKMTKNRVRKLESQITDGYTPITYSGYSEMEIVLTVL